MLGNLRNKIIFFLASKREIPILAGLAAGLYPLVYYYDKNFTLINSWNQFFFFLFIYILIPIITFYVIYKIFSKTSLLSKYGSYVLPILNLCLFAFLAVITTYGFNKKVFVFAVLIAFVLAVLLKNHFKKIVVFQLLLAALVFPKLLPDFYRYITYSKAWIQQPDAIEEVVFKKKPNVYIIQPDGYANFSELRKDNYNFDNSDFESFLVKNDFKLYENFRSNYFSTLSSNSSMFAMKHHYYNTPISGMNELYNARDIIVGNNPVVSIFKKNNYKTFLLLEKSYLLLNRPKVNYDYSNLENHEISFFSRGYNALKDISQDLETVISKNENTNNFYFVEKMKPGHIATYKRDSGGAEKERLNYIIEIEEANVWLKQIINIINKKDPKSLIVIVADHGGFVGMDYTLQSKEKQTKTELIETVFTAALAIKWPDREPDFDDRLKTNVNLFRILFSYLSDNEIYLKNLQEDKSYTVIEKGSDFGVYELINEKGEVVFNALQK